jgi:hypothetical protein
MQREERFAEVMSDRGEVLVQEPHGGLVEGVPIAVGHE